MCAILKYPEKLFIALHRWNWIALPASEQVASRVFLTRTLWEGSAPDSQTGVWLGRTDQGWDGPGAVAGAFQLAFRLPTGASIELSSACGGRWGVTVP